MEYSASVADFFTYDNLRPEEDWHPKIKDVVYWGKHEQTIDPPPQKKKSRPKRIVPSL